MNFIPDIENAYHKYIVSKNTESMKEYCFPKKFTLQTQQLFLSDYLSDKNSAWNIDDNIRGILIYHQIGSGKTCTSISIAEKLKKKYKILVILPAALINNFVDELLSECTGDEYISKNDRKNIHDKKILDKAYKKISKWYTICSYHKFINLIDNNQLKLTSNTILIIDEIQNMISLTGLFYKKLKNFIKQYNKKLKVILLTATPIFDKPIEAALTLNLLTIKDIFDIDTFNQQYIIKSSKKYSMINKEKFKQTIKYLISYYCGAPPQTYPISNFKIVKCCMNNFQNNTYNKLYNQSTNKILNLDIMTNQQNFFIIPRILMNVTFPNQLLGDEGFNSFTGNILKMQNIQNYSIKFYTILKKINRSEGPCFMYSNFRGIGGIDSFIRFIEYHGWKKYTSEISSKKCYAIWSSEENEEYKKEVKKIFNNKSNINGTNIKLIIGSPSIKEGITLLRVRQVHILEPYWNISRIMQIMGRAIRFCSHKDVIKSKRFVNVYLYLSTSPNGKTIDQYIWSIAKRKQQLIEQFEHCMKEAAIDCKLFYKRNIMMTNKHIKCIK